MVEGKTKLGIDQEKIEQASQWDGLHGVITNLPNMPQVEVLAHYRGLWQVEESFRITKHDLKVRPIYHWTPRRIRAHIAIAFMAFACVRHLMYRVKLQYQALSPAVIRIALIHIQHSILEHQYTHKRYFITSQVSPEAKKIYQLMGLSASTVPCALD